MKKIILSVLAVLEFTAASKEQFKPGVKVAGEPDDQPGIKPVENEEVFDHLFLDQYMGLTILSKTAA